VTCPLFSESFAFVVGQAARAASPRFVGTFFEFELRFWASGADTGVGQFLATWLRMAPSFFGFPDGVRVPEASARGVGHSFPACIDAVR
jgi:hypothetical protein